MGVALPVHGHMPRVERTTPEREVIMPTKKKSGKSSGRELINTGSDKRFVRRGASGKFTESDDVGRSLSQDRRRKAKTAAKSGQGDKGDRRK
jgi:hypothetical protein